MSQDDDAYGVPKANGTPYIAMTEFTETQLTYLWKPYLPRGKLVMVGGDAGIGKSWFTLWVAAQLTRPDRVWPWEARNGPQEVPNRTAHNVIITSAEDDTEDTVLPRLRALGADLTRVYTHAEDAEEFDDFGLKRLEEAIGDTHAGLFVADPFAYFFGELRNMNQANAVRGFMTKVKKVAQKHACTGAFVTHLTKGRQGSLLSKIIGSVDTTAVVRSVLVAKRWRDWTVLDHAKINVGEPGMTLRWKLIKDEDDPDKLPQFYIERATGLAAAELQDIEDEQVLQGTGGPREFDRAVEWLLNALVEPMPVNQLNEEAESNGIAKRTLARARQHVGAVAEKRGRVWWIGRGAGRVDEKAEVDATGAGDS